MEMFIIRFLFNYIKTYFNDIHENTSANKIFGLELSIFKGLLERFLIYYALAINLTQILIVFGAIKIGTRLDKSDKVKNDYFLVGNFISILIAIFYYNIFQVFI